MPTTHVIYNGLSFPCSRAGGKPPLNRFSARQLVSGCDLPSLLKLGRPTDREIQQLWMRRFVSEMHWLPLIELLSGCQPDTDPVAHRAFISALADRNASRIAHRTWGENERYFWAELISSRLRPLCPDSAVNKALRASCAALPHSRDDVLFVGDDCIAAAEKARPACILDTPWLLYKAVTVVRGRLPAHEERPLIAGQFYEDPSAEAYYRFLENGEL